VTELKNNYPNPFNPVTRLQYQLEQAGQVKLVVYNALGHEIKTLVNENQAQGSHAVVWDGTNNRGAFVSSGVYFVRMTYNNYTRIQKMLLVK
ncbi:T9SS type A sorting domain-containing protein, partial [candidate division KSB1 bacterium]|nr:T9SS type A sorting domain-containing protein [candidate division KSB1 bacterium]